MVLKDLIITPFYLIILFAIAYGIRPYVTNRLTRKYFIPGLTVKFIGAIALGVIYQFYYGGGDTFVYHENGSKWIWEAFSENPLIGLNLIFSEMVVTPLNFEFANKIYMYGDSASYFVVRVAGIFDLLTFQTYSATALLFAMTSYIGIWAMFTTFYKFFPSLHKRIAIGVLFVPSVFFWGSGILKDTLTIGAIGCLFYGIVHLLFIKEKFISSVIATLLGFFVLFSVKIYILLCFMPAIAFWALLQFQHKIRSTIIRTVLTPLVLAFSVGISVLSIFQIGADSARYSIDSVLITAEETARWNYYVSERSQGSGYSLGDYDFSSAGLARKAVPAVATTFFRPFLWEVRNPVMLLSALEGTVVILLFLRIFIRKSNFSNIINNPILVSCFVFAILFAFSVGVTTYNFGSLVRYKIPMLPFLFTALLITTAPRYKTQETRR